MSTKTFCDRCGKEARGHHLASIELRTVSAAPGIASSPVADTPWKGDLCGVCARELERWVDTYVHEASA